MGVGENIINIRANITLFGEETTKKAGLFCGLAFLLYLCRNFFLIIKPKYLKCGCRSWSARMKSGIVLCLDVGILGYGVETWAALLPFGRGVFAPDAAVAHYLCVGEFLTERDEEIAQRGFLLRCSVVGGYNHLTTYLADTTDIGNVDGGGVVALHSVAYFFNGEHLMGSAIGCDDIMIAWVFPSLRLELCPKLFHSP